MIWILAFIAALSIGDRFGFGAGLATLLVIILLDGVHDELMAIRKAAEERA